MVISVVIPVYNSANTLRHALLSTLAALRKDDEVIVVDDGSADDSVNIAANIAQDDRRVRVIEHSTNLGVSAALTSGIEATRGDYIARMDSDDICLPWRFRQQRRNIVGRDLVFSGVIHFGTRKIRPTDPTPLHGAGVNLTLLLENPFAHPTALMTREILDGADGYRYLLAEDYDLWMRCATRGARIARYSTPTLLYRHHPGQVTKIQQWRLSALTEPPLRAAYNELALAELGVEAFWYDSLVKQTRDENAVEFRRLLVNKASEIPLSARMNLIRRFERVFPR